jgi:hypothetical protein
MDTNWIPDLEILWDKERTLQSMIKHLSDIQKERNIHSINDYLNWQEFSNAWVEFCSVYKLQDNEGRCSAENLRAAISIWEQELQKHDTSFTVPEVEKIKWFVDTLIALSNKKIKIMQIPYSLLLKC